MSEQQSTPNDDGEDNQPTGERRTVRKRKKISLPSVDRILYQLIQLNSAVILGAISTKDANLIHKNLNTVLQVQMKRANREESGHHQEAMMDICRSDPRMVNALEPFLSDAQLRSLMEQNTEPSDESV